MKNQIFNPFLPEGVYIPDGEPHVFGDRVYIYGSHDKIRSSRYCPGDYVVWSAPVSDLSKWTNGGVAYARRGKRNRLGFRCMWAPDCARGVDGRYYLYYCFDFDNRICVAVSDEPDKNFVFYGYVRHKNGVLYGKGGKDIMCFDPAVFVDDDGEVYLYSGYSANEDLKKMLNMRGIRNVDGTGGQVVRLESDMLTVKGEPKMLIPGYKNSAGTGFEGHEMYEASSLRKVNGRYYFIYSTRLSHELAYATSDRPDGEFTFGGAIISNGNIGFEGKSEKDADYYWGNVHGSIECVGGKWYVFYHRQTNKNEQTRQACAEPIEIAEDGSIKQVTMTSQGLSGRPLAGRGEYPAYTACVLKSKEGALKCAYGMFGRGKYKLHPSITEYEKGRQCIKGMRDGAVAGFKFFDLEGSTVVSVITRGSGGKLIVTTAQGGAPIAEIALKNTEYWACFSARAELPTGTAPLFFTYKGEGTTDILSFLLEPFK